MLASAQSHAAVFINGKGHRGESRAGVRAITKGLVFRAPAGTPFVLTFFQFHNAGCFGSNYWFVHFVLLVSVARILLSF
jgi:hypothetical protein